MADFLKKPLGQSLNDLAIKRATDQITQQGRALPCTVVEVVSSGVVVVNFEVNAAPIQLPNITIPILGSEYVRLPIQIGDKGLTQPADVRLGSISGLGASTSPGLDRPANLSALCFAWLGNTAWSETDDPHSVVIYGPNGVILRPTNSISSMAIDPGSILMDSSLTDMTGNLTVDTAATGSFYTADGKVVTVIAGVIVNIF